MEPYVFLMIMLAMTVILFILFICWKKPVGAAMKVIICTVLVIAAVITGIFVMDLLVPKKVEWETAWYNKFQDYANTFSRYLEFEKEVTLDAACHVADDKDIINAIENNNRDELARLLSSPSFKFINQSYIVCDAVGTVLARSNEPDLYGDSIMSLYDIQSALEGRRSVVYNDTLVQSVIVNACVPIYSHNSLIGVAVAMFEYNNYERIAYIKMLFNAEITVYYYHNYDYEIVASTFSMTDLYVSEKVKESVLRGQMNNIDDIDVLGVCYRVLFESLYNALGEPYAMISLAIPVDDIPDHTLSPNFDWSFTLPTWPYHPNNPGEESEFAGTVHYIDNITFLMDEIIPNLFDEYDRTSDWLRRLTHDTLLERDKYYNDITPALAQSWSLMGDGLTMYINLRDDVFFHNGDRLTSQDVVWTYTRAMEHGLISGLVQNVVAVDEYTILFEFRESINFPQENEWRDFLFELSLPMILSKNAMENDQGFGALIGTGPYSVAEYFPEAAIIVLEPNGNYWNGPQGPLSLLFMFETSASLDERISMLDRGEADMIFGLSIDVLNQYYMKDEFGVTVFPVELRSKEYHGFDDTRYESGVYGIIGIKSFGGIMPTDEIVIGDMHFRVFQ